ncbi:hypothetical protein H5410_060859 [Solanum commersonii]|uniref:Uncharacterized protein n=1 Tax=Solanum commersonii TaxID=4109 RepID=A0A9J5W666_SOLCO|nr:hypothetical protein H5410_060859 [Solanum commersonii]
MRIFLLFSILVPEAHNQMTPDAGKQHIIYFNVELHNIDTVEPDNDPPHVYICPIYHINVSYFVSCPSCGLLTNTNVYAANVFIKLKKPMPQSVIPNDACIISLNVNPDSTKGHKVRGIA